jgi:hypothetical protein
MDPNQLNQVNSNMNSLNQMNQMSYYQKNYHLPTEQINEGINSNVYSHYPGYYVGGMSNLMTSPNNYSAHNLVSSGQSHSMSLLNNSILTMPVAFSDKPWTRASKDPSLIQRGTELFVGNLSLDTFENDLFDIFRDCGEIIDVCHRIN